MPIATRILKIRRPEGDVEVPVHIFSPEQEAELAWKCEFEIAFPGNVNVEPGTA